MKYRTRIFYTDNQKGLMWARELNRHTKKKFGLTVTSDQLVPSCDIMQVIS